MHVLVLGSSKLETGNWQAGEDGCMAGRHACACKAPQRTAGRQCVGVSVNAREFYALFAFCVHADRSGRAPTCEIIYLLRDPARPLLVSE